MEYHIDVTSRRTAASAQAGFLSRTKPSHQPLAAAGISGPDIGSGKSLTSRRSWAAGRWPAITHQDCGHFNVWPTIATTWLIPYRLKAAQFDSPRAFLIWPAAQFPAFRPCGG